MSRNLEEDNALLRGLITKLAMGYNMIASGAVPAKDIKAYASKFTSMLSRNPGGGNVPEGKAQDLP